MIFIWFLIHFWFHNNLPNISLVVYKSFYKHIFWHYPIFLIVICYCSLTKITIFLKKLIFFFRYLFQTITGEKQHKFSNSWKAFLCNNFVPIDVIYKKTPTIIFSIETFFNLWIFATNENFFKKEIRIKFYFFFVFFVFRFLNLWFILISNLLKFFLICQPIVILN